MWTEFKKETPTKDIIKDAFAEIGKTVKDFMTYTGYNPSTVHRYLSGEQPMRKEVHQKLKRYLKRHKLTEPKFEKINTIKTVTRKTQLNQYKG